MDTWTDAAGAHAKDEGWSCTLTPRDGADGKTHYAMNIVSPLGGMYINSVGVRWRDDERNAVEMLATCRDFILDIRD